MNIDINSNKTKRAIITGITGQDGAYLTAFLLSKGYEVHGIQRRLSTENSWRLKKILATLPLKEQKKLFLYYGDMTDMASLLRVITLVQPDEIYNLAAQSHVAVSFETPEYTAQVDAVGLTRLLEAVKISGLAQKVRIYQASSSELFGSCAKSIQNEQTPFSPRSPYAAAKLYAYWIAVNYRQAYNMFISNGILFNHESPLRDETFVTRKITSTLARIYHGSPEVLSLGNLDSHRDWGYAAEYVEAMWVMLQHDAPDDFVIATGVTSSIRTFVELACAVINQEIIWQYAGLEEQGIDKKTGKLLVTVNLKNYRPTDVTYLHGDASKAHRVLNWQPTTTVQELARIMMHADLEHFWHDKNASEHRQKFSKKYTHTANTIKEEVL